MIIAWNLLSTKYTLEVLKDNTGNSDIFIRKGFLWLRGKYYEVARGNLHFWTGRNISVFRWGGEVPSYLLNSSLYEKTEKDKFCCLEKLFFFVLTAESTAIYKYKIFVIFQQGYRFLNSKIFLNITLISIN